MDEKGKNRRIKLTDGRMLGYAEFGSTGGKPVFYFHGFPSSRLDWLVSDPNDAAGVLNVRIIAPDRPGYSLSDYQRGRKLLDWPQDVLELADALQIDQFAVLGVSGGGPYMLPPAPTALAIDYAKAASFAAWVRPGRRA